MAPQAYDNRHPSPSLSDEALMGRVAADDVAAFAELARRYELRLYRFACRMLGGSSDAEDIVQETLLRLYQARGRYRTGSALKPWVFRIAANLCRDRLRWRRRRREVSLAVAEAREAPGGLDPVAATEAHEAEERLERALNALSEKHRAVFVMARCEGMPYEQVSEVLGIPLGTVKSRMNKAVRLLLAALGDAGAAQ
ncbi:MAG: RNA polymerase sigma factor [Gemmataceae bacterium]|nr:RNA polymerase sigma factor [Gemmataceae bacterium]